MAGATSPGEVAGAGQAQRPGNVAAIDCGTLSTRLLVSDQDGAAVVRLTRITKLGDGVDASRCLAPAAIDRVLRVLAEYRDVMAGLDVTAVRMVGTSALRDAGNRSAFTDAASDLVGAKVELLSGLEEASLSLLGASQDLSPTLAPWLVIDIGGGSTELAVGPGVATGAGSPARPPSGSASAASLDLGCVRVTERFLRHDPPRASELEQAASWLGDQLRRAETEVAGLRTARTLVGLAGTVSALASYEQGLTSYERARVHHFVLSLVAVRTALGRLGTLPSSQRAGLPGIEEARAPHIVGGTLVLVAAMEHFGFDECLVSEADILDGLALTLRCPPAGPRLPGL